MIVSRLVRLIAFCILPSLSLPQTTQAQFLDQAVDRLKLHRIPPSILAQPQIRRPLEALEREKCDRAAILDLGDKLQRASYRRDAAEALVLFSDTCDGYAEALRTAVNAFMTISDYGRAKEVSSKLIAVEPFQDNGYYLRGLAADRAGDSKGAIDDYLIAIELFGNKLVLSSTAFVAIARNYEKLGRICDAAHIVESWVGLNAEKNDTTQARAMIANYMQRGQCEKSSGKNEEVFALNPNRVVTVQVSINGVRGNFIVDTGATYVSIKSSFANKAKIEIDPEISLRLYSANGIVEAASGRAAVIKVRSLEAKNVAVAVQLDKNATYGEKIDGLLGMSFLSRFNVSLDARRLRLKAR